MFRLAGVKLYLSSTFHPQSNWQSEAADKVITMLLHCLSGDHPRVWSRWLLGIEFFYNSIFQSSLKTSPFKVVYNRDPLFVRSFVHTRWSPSPYYALVVDGVQWVPSWDWGTTGAGSTTLQVLLQPQPSWRRVSSRAVGVAMTPSPPDRITVHIESRQVGTQILWSIQDCGASRWCGVPATATKQCMDLRHVPSWTAKEVLWWGANWPREHAAASSLSGVPRARRG
jgi:hypothetical protein